MAEEVLDSQSSIPGEVVKPSKFIKGHSCGVCHKWFKRMGDLRRHGSVHFKEKLIPCDHCDLKFVSKDRLYHHRKYISLERDYKCNFCSRGFKTYAALKTHLPIHTGERPYACEMCNITFRRKNALHYHYASLTKLAHHKKFEQFKQFEYLVEKFKFLTNDGRENICSVCKKQFKTAKHLKQHTLIHGRAKFECDVCGLAFKQKHYILRHKRTMHSTNRKFFPCEICKKSFVSNYSVKLHKAAAHEHSKPFKCQICPQGYVKKSQLDNHMLSHEGVKKYACTMCDKRYTNISRLKYHMREHTGEKPYECEVCGKAFKGIDILKNHKKKCKKIETVVVTKQQTVDSEIGLVLPKNENTDDKNETSSIGNKNVDIKQDLDDKSSITKIVNQEASQSHPPVKLFRFGGKVVLPQNIKFIKVQNPAEFNLLRVTRLFERYRCLSNI